MSLLIFRVPIAVPVGSASSTSWVSRGGLLGAARATLTDPVLLAMVRRREPPQASREQTVRHGEIRRLAHAIRWGRHALAANRAQLQAIVDQIAPGLTERRGIGAVTAAQAIVSFSHPGRCRSDAAFAALSGTSPLLACSG